MIPDVPEYSIEVLCAIFNSKLAQFYYIKKFSGIKVLKSIIEKFPLPIVNKKIFLKIEAIVNELRFKTDAHKINELDELVLQLYGLCEDSSSIIRQSRFSGAFY